MPASPRGDSLAEQRPLWRSALDPLALGVAVASGVAGLGLHSVPVVSLGVRAYGALVAWDVLGKSPGRPER